jgi:hypothetical protein
MNIQYPKKISFLLNEKCDVCKINDRVSTLEIAEQRYLGWNICKNDECNKIVYVWFDETTIDLESLVEKYGNEIKVKRTSGEIEDDWEFNGQAYRLSADSHMWIPVRKKNTNLRKSIPMEYFLEWNVNNKK